MRQRKTLIGLIVTASLAALVALAASAAAQGMEDDKMEDGMMDDDKMEDGMMEDDAKENPSPAIAVVGAVVGLLAAVRRRRFRR